MSSAQPVDRSQQQSVTSSDGQAPPASITVAAEGHCDEPTRAQMAGADGQLAGATTQPRRLTEMSSFRG